MDGTPTSAAQRKEFFRERESGLSISAACKKAGISESTAYRILAAARSLKNPVTTARPSSRAELAVITKMQGPKSYARMSAEAKRALEDFDYFRLRYFGHLPTPWQRMSAETLVSMVQSEDKEYVVLNCPPGVGKTLMIHDIVCWLICRNRRVRILMGSATQALAQRNMMQVRRSLERGIVVTASSDHLAKGLAVDGVATLAGDYGRFQPPGKEVWNQEGFIVMQYEEDEAIQAKESTVTAYGLDTTYIGGRFDACFWDDTQDGRRIRSASLREQTELDWEDVAEARVDPGGMMVVIGQRLGADDIYRFCLNMEQPLEEDEEEAYLDMDELERQAIRREKKYKHILFRAHYLDVCKGTRQNPEHALSAKAYPNGCLLDPRRLTWRELSAKMTRGNRYSVVYQQEDVAPDSVLVQNDWVYGHGGFVGCMDKDRDLWEIPSDLRVADCLVVASSDPSPTNFWANELWIYHKPSEQRFLINLVRKKMDAPDFIDRLSDGTFVGLMPEWQATMARKGWPIQYWIVEQNGAQRFMLRYNHVKDFIRKYEVELIPHDTGRNKSDSEMGVTTIAPHYRFGRVRLMGKGEGKVCSLKLIDEVTKYPGGTRTDDCVMAQWFFEWNLDKLYAPVADIEPEWRPGWMTA